MSTDGARLPDVPARSPALPALRVEPQGLLIIASTPRINQKAPRGGLWLTWRGGRDYSALPWASPCGTRSRAFASAPGAARRTPSGPHQSLHSPNKPKGPARGPLAILAEREGFEPPDRRRSTVFKTAAFDHSATSPVLIITKFTALFSQNVT